MQDKTVLSVIELAQFLGVWSDSIYAMVREKQIPHFRVRRRILFSYDAVQTWIEQGG